MTGYQFLLEINAYNTTNQTEEVLRYSCAPGYTGGGYTWLPYIVDPGLFQVTLFSGGKTSGGSTYSYGEIILGNAKASPSVLSGPIDALKDYVFAGRTVKMYYGLQGALFPSGFTCSYVATMSDATIGWDTVSLSLKGYQALLDRIISYDTFAGDGSPLEGSSELRDKLKPILLGRAKNFSPVLVNAALLIYAISPLSGASIGQFNSGIHVYDSGVELYRQGRSTAILTDVPQAGSYLVSDDGYLRLGSSPKGVITCSAVQHDLGLKATPPAIIEWIFTKLFISVPTINAASLTALYLADKKEAGLYLSAKATVSQIIDQLLAPTGYWYFNHAGEVVFGQLVDPSGITPVYYASSDTNIASWSRAKTQDTTNGIPAKTVTVRHEFNYTVITQPLPATAVIDMGWLATDWKATLADTATKVHPNSEEMIIDTARGSLVPSLIGLYTVPRELITITIIRSDFLAAAAVLPGQCVSVDLKGRFNCSGKRMLVVGILINYVAESVQLTLWS